ncbi:UNVERIFIED_ORG: H+/gluconate symporter-like permease [Paraburkholderia sediminicola]|nr:H+/gluconate symporter-like permease [Paraburkholderia sediminicola]
MAAPIADLISIMLINPALVAPVFSGIYMEKIVFFMKLYFPVILLGAVFAKLNELAGFSEAIVVATIRYIGQSRANAVIVTACALLTYGGVSTFVVVFAVYPFAAEFYRQANIPKRLMPGALALGSFSFTMDALPGSPQISNIIPTTFFKTTSWAAPGLGVIGSIFIVAAGLTLLEWRRRIAMRSGEGYGTGHINEPERTDTITLPPALLAAAPLIVVVVGNFCFTELIPKWYWTSVTVSPQRLPGLHSPLTLSVSSVVALWAIEAALICGIVLVAATAFRRVRERFAAGTRAAVSIA